MLWRMHGKGNKMTDKEIYEEIETHSDNGIPPSMLVKLVSSVLGLPKGRVFKVWKVWMRDAGWWM